MSDITGPPLPKPIEPVSRTTGKTSGVSKDPNQAQTETRDQRGETSSKSEQPEASRSRDPAVSIAATAAHLEVGERLKEQVQKIDQEGRPIIVTETATFALKPDAGLRPGDDVHLNIVEAGQKVAADLLEKNGHPIKPPIRLALVVIAVHARPTEAVNEPITNLQKDRPARLYQPSSTIPPLKVAPLGTESETLATLLSAKNTLQNTPLPEETRPHIPSEGQNTKETASPPLSKTGTSSSINQGVAYNSRNSSPDLATLLEAQQRISPNAPTYTKVNTDRSLAIEPSHILQQSDIVQKVDQAGGKNASSSPVQAYSMQGYNVKLHVVDNISTTTLSSEPNRILTIRPITTDQVAALNVPTSTFGPKDTPLAMVDTEKGQFLAPLRKVSALSGSQFIAQPLDKASTDHPLENTVLAKLISPNSSSSSQVKVSFEKNVNTASTASGIINIKAIHTIRAFPSPQGPMADYRIETHAGDLFVTLPSDKRITLEDGVRLVPHNDGIARLMATQQPAMLDSSMSTALSSVGVHGWPALDKSLLDLATLDQSVANELASRSVQNGSKLANSLLFFLSAAGRNDPNQWIGANAENILAQKDSSLLDLLKSEITKLMTAATDTTTDWRPILLPFEVRNGDMPILAILFGHPHKGSDAEGNNTGTKDDDDDETGQRFVVEVRFSLLGAIQLDGLIQNNYFSLAMHTEAALNDRLKSEVTDLFNRALDANNFEGALAFYDTSAFPVDVDAVMQSYLN